MRTLVSEDGSVRIYHVTDDSGRLVGMDSETIPTPEQTNETTIRDRAQAALAANAAFLALTNPTAAQNAAQVKALTRQNTALIRLALGRFDAAD